MRRVRVAAVALLAALVLAGCGPTEGTVVEKQYSPAEWYWTTCYRTESVVSSGGAVTSRQVPYPCQQYRPASYDLYLREEVGVASSREPEAGWRSVGERVYMACKVGQYYRDGKCTG